MEKTEIFVFVNFLHRNPYVRHAHLYFYKGFYGEKRKKHISTNDMNQLIKSIRYKKLSEYLQWTLFFVHRKKRGELLSVSDIPSGSYFFINFSCTHRQKDTHTLIYTPI